jgi:hypothetical protein
VTSQSWGLRVAYIRDPDGNLLELMRQLLPGEWSQWLREADDRYVWTELPRLTWSLANEARGPLDRPHPSPELATVTARPSIRPNMGRAGAAAGP